MESHSPFFWFILTCACIAIQAFYNMVEMAIVSFNKVRLQYYVNKGEKRPLWIYELIQKPSRLFGTTLLGVTIALQVGSECARQFYLALHMNPDFALITQFFLVVIIAELSPIFAARRYAENVALLGVPIVYGSSIIMAPIVWLCGIIANSFIKFFAGNKQEPDLFLSREEIQRIVEEQEEGGISINSEKSEFNLIVSNIFHIKNKTAKQVMQQLSEVKMIPSTANIGQMRLLQAKHPSSYLPVFHRYRTHIIGIAFSRDLIRIPDNRRVRDYAKSPWFITEQTILTEILNQFKHNNQDVAVVLNETGQATGLLSLEDILSEIFDEDEHSAIASNPFQEQLLVERSFPGSLKIEEFNIKFRAELDDCNAETLEELMVHYLGSHPQAGESIRIDRFEFTIEESSLLGIKTISVRTLI